MSRNYELSGPDVKIRGTAMHIAEKYSSLARDAMSSGDTSRPKIISSMRSIITGSFSQLRRKIQARPASKGSFPSMGAGLAPTITMAMGMATTARKITFPRHSRSAIPERQFPERQFSERAAPERVAYNPNQPQPYIPQNAFPQIQPQPVAPAAPNGATPHTGEGFAAPQDGDRLARLRRRRPIGEPQVKTFNGRNGNGGPNAAPAGNGSPLPGADPKPDEAAS